MASINNFPVEILLPIFLLCATEEYQNLALCSRRLLTIATSEEFLSERFLEYHRKQKYLLENWGGILWKLNGLLKWEWLNRSSAHVVGWDTETMAVVVGFIWHQFSVFAQYNINKSRYPFYHNASLTAQSAPTDPVDLKNALLIDVFKYGFIDAHVVWANLRTIKSFDIKDKYSEYSKYPIELMPPSSLRLPNEHACNIRLAMAKLLLKGCENGRGLLRLWSPTTTEHDSASSPSIVPSSGGLPRTLLCLNTLKLADQGLYYTNITIANEHLLILCIHTDEHMFGLVEAITINGKYIRGSCLFRTDTNLATIRQVVMWGEFDEKIEYEVAGVAWDDPESQKSAEYFGRCWRQLKWDLFSSQDYSAEEVFFWGWR